MKKVPLPDFDDMINLAEDIGRLKTALMIKEASLEQLKASITETVLSHVEYWDGENKSPSMARIRDTYHVRGYNDETCSMLMDCVNDIANITGELKSKENVFRVYQDMIGVWRTQSANERYDAS